MPYVTIGAAQQMLKLWQKIVHLRYIWTWM